MASIRQKLLHKISRQSQLSKPRENFAVIELNDASIAGDFAVWSSLSGGYKLKVGLESGRYYRGATTGTTQFLTIPAPNT